MKKTRIVLCLIVLFSIAYVTAGQETALEQEKKEKIDSVRYESKACC